LAVTNRATLRATLAQDYNGLFKRLKKRLGSADLASEALHETFLRVDQVSSAVELQRPNDYLFRIAINIATDRRRADNRLLSGGEIDGLLQVVDEAPDPARIVEAREDVKALQKALAELPRRRREIFTSALVGRTPNHKLAELYGVDVRTVEKDLKRALQHCADRLGRKLLRRGGGPRSRS
jgi:RNA polymerase sigma-70 factor, ECF subfamily